MPSYGAPYKGVQFSAAYKQAAAIAPLQYAMLHAYELWHESFDEPIYFVNDPVDLVATIEAGAERNAGTEQTFVACLLDLQRPEESDSAASPEISLGRQGVSGLLKEALDRARGSLVPWQLIERIYASNDTSGPAKLPPAVYYPSRATLSGVAASFSASYGDPTNVSIPTRTFRRDKYPSLDF